ncbi:unnamed protein product [Notodromas monacha]|uniref:F-box domain-containing protein n=1 Tax=Notodromas monacha TaxID=399045 RepID=A0A7R9BYV1_9CRUS|nr:unnamed protein product [Notodromas monacha]CAG0922833.1 unnamed protein product [Notodromas monacha]
MWGGVEFTAENTALLADREDGHPRSRTTIEKLPDKVLMHIFSYLPHREICRNARVCKKWRMIAYDSRLWKSVSLRPEISGLQVTSLENLLALLRQYIVRFGPSLQYIELPIELITHTVLHELANKCPNLTSMLMDFSTAMQLHDFNELQAFPAKLNSLCICLSGVIFMEGFMRKIYNFINGLEVLHLIGTYERVEEEEEEIYEVVNIHKLKSATPNLVVVNLYGINFLDDGHVEAFSSNCIQLECMSAPYCGKVTGSCLKTLLNRCKRLQCLILTQTSLKSEYVMNVEWDKTQLQELDITATDLSQECLIEILTKLKQLRYLSAGQQDSFNDKVLARFLEQGSPGKLVALDLDRCDNLSNEGLQALLGKYGSNLLGLILSGIPTITDQLLISVMPQLRNLRILGVGTAEGCCPKVHTKVLVDQLVEAIANNCHKLERVEIRWDGDTLRHSDKSQKAIDHLRTKALRLKSLVLSEGKYFENVKANFERADRPTVVRSNTLCSVSNCYLLSHYKHLLFN